MKLKFRILKFPDKKSGFHYNSGVPATLKLTKTYPQHYHDTIYFLDLKAADYEERGWVLYKLKKL
jgi:hypothetical protein